MGALWPHHRDLYVRVCLCVRVRVRCLFHFCATVVVVAHAEMASLVCESIRKYVYMVVLCYIVIYLLSSPVSTVTV